MDRKQMFRQLAELSDIVKKWLMEEYECVKVPIGSYPEFEISKDKHVTYGSKQIDIQSELPLVDWMWNEVNHAFLKNSNETIDEFKKKIVKTLEDNGFKKGDTIYIREWPIFMMDETVLRLRKFGYYGWMEVYCEEIEL